MNLGFMSVTLPVPFISYLPPGPQPVKVVEIPRVGLPAITITGVLVDPSVTNRFRVTTTLPPADTSGPFITSHFVDFSTGQPTLVLTGTNLGSTNDNYSATFELNNVLIDTEDAAISKVSGNNVTELRVPISQKVPVGSLCYDQKRRQKR